MEPRSTASAPGSVDRHARSPASTTTQAFANTGAVPITDIGALRRPPTRRSWSSTPRTGERQPIWTELDTNARATRDRTLIIRPAKNFDEGHRYIVALRSLQDAPTAARSTPAPPSRRCATAPSTDDSAPHALRHGVFPVLSRAGIERADLYLAWDFTVASAPEHSPAGMLQIRDDAFRQLGDDNLADVQGRRAARRSSRSRAIVDYAAGRRGDPLCQGGAPARRHARSSTSTAARTANDKIARDVKGTIDVPCYLDTPGCAPGTRSSCSTPTATRRRSSRATS